MKKTHALKGRPSVLRGRGKNLAWLKAHVGYDGEDCLIWPFSKDGFYGRGRIGVDGKLYWAHHYMCILVNGPAPLDKPQAAHSCGNGHKGCIHPRHLGWKDNSENQRDRREHGRPEGGKGTRTHLTPAQIAEIRSSKGIVPQLKLADKFG